MKVTSATRPLSRPMRWAGSRLSMARPAIERVECPFASYGGLSTNPMSLLWKSRAEPASTLNQMEEINDTN